MTDVSAPEIVLVGVFLSLCLRGLRGLLAQGSQQGDPAAPADNRAHWFAQASTWRAQQGAPTDREAAEQAAVSLFRNGGLSAPTLVAWARSPREALQFEGLLALFLRRVHSRGADPASAWAEVAALPFRPGTLQWEARERLAAQLAPRLTGLHAVAPGSGLPENAVRERLGASAVAVERDFQYNRMQLLAAGGGNAGNLEHTIGQALRQEAGVWLGDPLGMPPALDRFLFADPAELARIVEPQERLRALDYLHLAAAAFGWRPLDGAAVLIERPVVCHLDAASRPHGPDGPALRFADGWSIWAWEGDLVSREAIEDPDSLDVAGIRALPDGLRRLVVARRGEERYADEVGVSAELIALEPNFHLLRTLVERYGQARYVAEAGLVIDADLDSVGEPRRLWSAPRGHDAPLVVLEVANSTPEPDSSRHRYWLRVPPQTRTCREAVAWTFGLTPNTYAPVIET